MYTALVLLNTEKGRINEVAEALADIPGITEVYSLAGPHDLAAVIRVRELDDIADIVTHRMLKIDGIRDSQTHVAFRVHSRHALEDMFAVGNEA
ncbi:AsnC family transcriptional regulator [Plasticicumulans lactativorans]|uniref:AsnC family transcriptional regulator n=1 Tax=Plasticicumulans lactativorans TaxID=1133106 RepID=A0A4R2LI38_9GAMM|nr:Lrp/AsnC ligand binding domain-containing protein [Plasticicumulans lactativorans]TCO82801.1 AsnC family transcriptional regulator [Plasticicumulans lactativorans]